MPRSGSAKWLSDHSRGTNTGYSIPSELMLSVIDHGLDGLLFGQYSVKRYVLKLPNDIQ